MLLKRCCHIYIYIDVCVCLVVALDAVVSSSIVVHLPFRIYYILIRSDIVMSGKLARIRQFNLQIIEIDRKVKDECPAMIHVRYRVPFTLHQAGVNLFQLPVERSHIEKCRHSALLRSDAVRR